MILFRLITLKYACDAHCVYAYREEEEKKISFKSFA